MAKEFRKLLTPVFQISFPSLFKAQSYNGGTEKYSCSAIWNPEEFTKKEAEQWAAILAEMDDQCKVRFGKTVDKLPGNFKKGLRDGAEKDLPGYGEGKIFASLTTRIRPGVVDLHREEISPEAGNDEEIYPGAYCRATVSIYTYDQSGGKGVALGLQNIQKVRDGDRLVPKYNPGNDFDDEF